MHLEIIKYQMSQESQQYYLVVDEQQAGPFTLEEIAAHSSLTPESLVWKPGYDNWVAAKTLPELSPLFINNPLPPNTPPDFNAAQDSIHTPDEDRYIRNRREDYQSPNPDYNRRYEERNEHNRFANNPQYQSNHSYNHRHNEYNDGYQHRQYSNRNYERPVAHTNWLPWAIVATILGMFSWCIGAILGIIGIVMAARANNFYSQGMEIEGNSSNTTAKTLTIIALILDGIGLGIVLFMGSLFSSIYNVLGGTGYFPYY